ncbi:MAG: beta-propeller fold lactonase family protein, partial [Mycobacterium sp.]|nr:beta-propeller fold lactonase family protein [Mycobacterium sp.]
MTIRTRLRPLAVATLLSAGVLSSVLAPAASASADEPSAGVYTMTNATTGNTLLAFRRGRDGSLSPKGTYPTGGNGTGTGLGSGHSIVVSDDGHELVVVNAGSSSISAFRVYPNRLEQIDKAVDSGGTRPISVTIDNDRVYVLNADSNSIAGFRLDTRGLTPIAGSVRQLGSGTSTPSQIQFDKTGHVLIVDERGSSTIDTFVVDEQGVAGSAKTTPSNAGGPFGFDINRRGDILLSAVALSNGQMSGASSYDVSRSGTLRPNGVPVTSGQAAACWLAAAEQFAYTTNAGSGSIGRFSVARDGSLSLTGTTTLGEGSHPLDEGVSRNQDYLYVLVDGFHQIIGYRVERDGGLTQV